jgi:molybdopterin synthase sulfur carrier subunit
MAILRLFANLRETAGVSQVEIEGQTVGQIISGAKERFGPAFAAGVASAAVWRNGDAASMDDPVSESDEVALIPPVSGGAATTGRVAYDVSSLAGLLAAAVLGVALATGDGAWWAALLVGVAAAWVIDIGILTEARGRRLPVVGILFTLVAAAVTTSALGGVGWGMALALAVIGTMGWGVALPSYRGIPSVAPGVLLALLASAAVGSLVLARQEFHAEHRAATMFMLTVGVGTVAGALLERIPNSLIDPFSGTALGAVLASVIAAVVLEQDVIGYLLVGMGVAVAMVGGRGFGSLIRSGRMALTVRGPGVLPMLDGAILAGGIYYPLLRLVL